jgi:hypothetical protein
MTTLQRGRYEVSASSTRESVMPVAHGRMSNCGMSEASHVIISKRRRAGSGVGEGGCLGCILDSNRTNSVEREIRSELDHETAEKKGASEQTSGAATHITAHAPAAYSLGLLCSKITADVSVI